MAAILVWLTAAIVHGVAEANDHHVVGLRGGMAPGAASPPPLAFAYHKEAIVEHDTVQKKLEEAKSQEHLAREEVRSLWDKQRALLDKLDAIDPREAELVMQGVDDLQRLATDVASGALAVSYVLNTLKPKMALLARDVLIPDKFDAVQETMRSVAAKEGVKLLRSIVRVHLPDREDAKQTGISLRWEERGVERHEQHATAEVVFAQLRARAITGDMRRMGPLSIGGVVVNTAQVTEAMLNDTTVQRIIVDIVATLRQGDAIEMITRKVTPTLRLQTVGALLEDERALEDEETRTMLVEAIKQALMAEAFENEVDEENHDNGISVSVWGEVDEEKQRRLCLHCARGLRWKLVAAAKPDKGQELENAMLSEALHTRTNFTEDEWRAFGVKARILTLTHYVRVGGAYFRPTDPVYHHYLLDNMIWSVRYDREEDFRRHARAITLDKLLVALELAAADDMAVIKEASDALNSVLGAFESAAQALQSFGRPAEFGEGEVDDWEETMRNVPMHLLTRVVRKAITAMAWRHVLKLLAPHLQHLAFGGGDALRVAGRAINEANERLGAHTRNVTWLHHKLAGARGRVAYWTEIVEAEAKYAARVEALQVAQAERRRSMDLDAVLAEAVVTQGELVRSAIKLLALRKETRNWLIALEDDLHRQWVAVNTVKTVSAVAGVVGFALLFTPFAPVGVILGTGASAVSALTSIGDYIATAVKRSNFEQWMAKDKPTAQVYVSSARALSGAFSAIEAKYGALTVTEVGRAQLTQVPQLSGLVSLGLKVEAPVIPLLSYAMHASAGLTASTLSKAMLPSLAGVAGKVSIDAAGVAGKVGIDAAREGGKQAMQSIGKVGIDAAREGGKQAMQSIGAQFMAGIGATLMVADCVQSWMSYSPLQESVRAAIDTLDASVKQLEVVVGLLPETLLDPPKPGPGPQPSPSPHPSSDPFRPTRGQSREAIRDQFLRDGYSLPEAEAAARAYDAAIRSGRTLGAASAAAKVAADAIRNECSQEVAEDAAQAAAQYVDEKGLSEDSALEGAREYYRRRLEGWDDQLCYSEGLRAALDATLEEVGGWLLLEGSEYFVYHNRHNGASQAAMDAGGGKSKRGSVKRRGQVTQKKKGVRRGRKKKGVRDEERRKACDEEMWKLHKTHTQYQNKSSAQLVGEGKKDEVHGCYNREFYVNGEPFIIFGKSAKAFCYLYKGPDDKYHTAMGNSKSNNGLRDAYVHPKGKKGHKYKDLLPNLTEKAHEFIREVLKTITFDKDDGAFVKSKLADDVYWQCLELCAVVIAEDMRYAYLYQDRAENPGDTSIETIREVIEDMLKVFSPRQVFDPDRPILIQASEGGNALLRQFHDKETFEEALKLLGEKDPRFSEKNNADSSGEIRTFLERQYRMRRNYE